MALQIRLLESNDGQAYKRIRLNALKLAPTAFTTSWEKARQLPDDFFIGRATPTEDSFIYGAFNTEQLVGTAGGFIELEPKRNYVAHVVGMWVEPDHRQQGIARQLLDAVCQRLQFTAQVTSIRLEVTAGNISALTLYEQYGFKAWGTEPDALRHNNQYHGSIHMVLAR